MDKYDGPIMCSYKLCDIKSQYWGIQTKSEQLIVDYQVSMFLSTMRRVVTLMDDWTPITFEQVREMEKKNKEDLDEKRAHGEFVNTFDLPNE